MSSSSRSVSSSIIDEKSNDDRYQRQLQEIKNKYEQDLREKDEEMQYYIMKKTNDVYLEHKDFISTMYDHEEGFCIIDKTHQELQDIINKMKKQHQTALHEKDQELQLSFYRATDREQQIKRQLNDALSKKDKKELIIKQQKQSNAALTEHDRLQNEIKSMIEIIKKSKHINDDEKIGNGQQQKQYTAEMEEMKNRNDELQGLYKKINKRLQDLLKEKEAKEHELQRQIEALKNMKDNKQENNIKENKNINDSKQEDENEMEEMQLIPATDDDNDDDDKEEVVIENMSKERLVKKYKILRSQNLATQKKMMQLISPCEDKSDFPVIEDIRAQFDTLRKQYCTDIFDEITSEIADQYENDWEKEEEEEDDDDDLFDALVDREARRILFDLLHITYHYIRMYKHSKFTEVIDAVALKFEVTSCKKKIKMNKSMGMVLNPYFQSYYKIFCRHRLMRDDGKNNKNGELLSGDMNKIIDKIFQFIKKQYGDYKFWNNKSISAQFEAFITKTCELCWIMVLNAPMLYFYPRIFSINDQDIAKKRYDENVSYIYNQIGENQHNKEEKQKKKKKKNKKKGKGKGKGKENDNDEKDEEEEMDKIVKEHEFNPFKCQLFDDKYHDSLNEADDDVDNNDNNDKQRNIINHNGMPIAYYGWPSMVRIPQLESEQHTQITKTFVYFHRKPQEFMSKIVTSFGEKSKTYHCSKYA